MSTTHEHSGFQVGQRVRIELGHQKLSGVIIEDRGNIGARGRHLYEVSIHMDPFDPMTMELSDEEIELIEPGHEKEAPISKEDIIAYLKAGALIAILRTNSPRVWICRGNLGGLTYTFIPERGVIGGQSVPLETVHDGKVFEPKREDVVSFLESFGLDRRQANEVIAAVGTAP